MIKNPPILQKIVVLRGDMSNRDTRRAALAEYARIYEKIQGIDLAFVDAVFSEDDSSYDAIYTIYHFKWKSVCDYIAKVIKPKYWIVNVWYFSDIFAPLEHAA